MTIAQANEQGRHRPLSHSSRWAPCGKKSFTLRLSEDARQEVEAIADSEGRNLSETVEYLIIAGASYLRRRAELDAELRGLSILIADARSRTERPVEATA